MALELTVLEKLNDSYPEERTHVERSQNGEQSSDLEIGIRFAETLAQ
jgi:hypothetical protein